jgi:hypothetical protein
MTGVSVAHHEACPSIASARGAVAVAGGIALVRTSSRVAAVTATVTATGPHASPHPQHRPDSDQALRPSVYGARQPGRFLQAGGRWFETSRAHLGHLNREEAHEKAAVFRAHRSAVTRLSGF